MKTKEANKHKQIQDSVAEDLKNKSVTQILQVAVNTKVITDLDGTIRDIKIRINTSSGHAWIKASTQSIESTWNGQTRTHPLINEPEAQTKIKMISQHLENQHLALRSKE